MLYYNNTLCGQPQNAVLETSFDDETTAITITEPLTVSEAAAHCKIEVTDDDTILAGIISAARAECEKFTGRGFVVRDITAIVKNELGGIRIPYPPINSITSIEDADGNAIAPESYVTGGIYLQRIVYPVASYLKISYNSGFTVLPWHFKQQVLNQILWLYQNRGDAAKGDADTLAPQVKAALSKYRLIA